MNYCLVMLSTRELLKWHLEAGVDETIGDKPMDYYAAYAAAKAVKETAKAALVEQTVAAPSSPQTLASAPKKVEPKAEEILHNACEVAGNAKTVDELRQALVDFDGCALKNTATNLVFVGGNAKAKIIFVGEAPMAEEDRQGIPFVGPAGKFLDRMLASIGLNRDNVLITNTVFWRPPGNRSLNPSEIALCMPFVERLVELVDPEILVALGAPVAKSLLAQTANISRLRGKWFSYSTPRLPRPVQATALFHPAYLLSTPAQKRAAWKDLLALKKKLSSLTE